MAAAVVDRLPEGDEWLYEVKFDGYRALLMKRGERVEIRSRNDKDLTRTYPSVAAAARRLRADSAVIDGEIVAVDTGGHPSFQRGRERIWELEPRRLERARRCLDQISDQWDAALARLAAFVE